VQKSGANDRFLVNPTIRWRGQEWLLTVDPGGSIAVPRMPAIGATPPLPRGPAKVPSLSRLRTVLIAYCQPVVF
jgi:hypothetical protein